MEKGGLKLVAGQRGLCVKVGWQSWAEVWWILRGSPVPITRHSSCPDLVKEENEEALQATVETGAHSCVFTSLSDSPLLEQCHLSI